MENWVGRDGQGFDRAGCHGRSFLHPCRVRAVVVVLGALLGLACGGDLEARAQERPLEPDAIEFSIDTFERGFCDAETLTPGVRHQLSDEEIGNSTAILPSLWLKRDIFAYQARFGRKIFEGWLACPGSSRDRGRIDLVVNGQLWSVLDYFERYELVQQFGLGSDRPDERSQLGYNLRVFNRQGRALGSYTCNSPSLGSVNGEISARSFDRPSSKCQVVLNDANNGLGLRNRLAN